ncbi:MAG: glycosyl transferase [Luteitalea sp.]|nr:glycosyl transferase [Luteitalea sp.]
MSDFYQTGVLATFHQLQEPRDLARLEQELVRHARIRPIALILPALFSEFETEALPRIIEQLRSVPYLKRIVLSLDRAERAQFDEARKRLSTLTTPVTVVWHDGPRLQDLYDQLIAHELPIGQQGKGRSCWMSTGYLLAQGDCEVIAMHDADILTYDRSMLARLVYPVTNPTLGYDFAKGYYPRVSRRRMHGRATRLLMTPLVRSLVRIVGYHPYLVYLDSFRYVLAGEVAMVADLARVVRVPADWGLEVGTLGEVYRNTSIRRVCQVGLSSHYDHKHRELSPDDPSTGLLKMSIDISKSIFRTLASEGITLSTGTFQTLSTAYVRTAEDTIQRFLDDATINGLIFDRHAEETAVETFAKGIRIAAEQFLADPLGVPLIPNWNRIASAIPDFLDRLQQAVDADNA